VVQVMSGDTLQVNVGGSVQTVRLIGIDAPEPTECYGREAAARLNELVGGQTMSLVPDVSGSDAQGQLLRYAFVGQGFINAELVRGGFAAATDDGVNVAHAEDLARLGREAQSQGAGFWGACGGPHVQGPNPASVATTPTAASAQPQPTPAVAGTPQAADAPPDA
jgi:micrococcal nuclease